MAINIADEYTYAEPANADYPGGSFKNDSTGDTGDGTPLEKAWANDFLGFFQALMTTAGVVPSGAPDTALASQYMEAMESIMWAPGDYKWCSYSTPGRRWLECNGGTIGNAASNASERANADTFPLFAKLWGEAAYTIRTSTGSASTRGANAVADFAANKQMVIPESRGEFMRGWDHGRGVDAGRALGSWQDSQNKLHGHPYASASNSNGGTDTTGGIAMDAQGTQRIEAEYTGAPAYTHDQLIGGSGGTDARPRNIAGMLVIRY